MLRKEIFLPKKRHTERKREIPQMKPVHEITVMEKPKNRTPQKEPKVSMVKEDTFAMKIFDSSQETARHEIEPMFLSLGEEEKVLEVLDTLEQILHLPEMKHLEEEYLENAEIPQEVVEIFRQEPKDSFLSLDIPDVDAAEPHVLRIIKQGSQFTFGRKDLPNERSREKVTNEVQPIRSLRDLAKTVDFIDKLMVPLDPHTPEKQVGEYTFTIVTSGELISFIEMTQGSLKNLRKAKQGESLENIHKQMVKISSTETEIIIELEELKELIAVLKLREKLKKNEFGKVTETAIEELGLHTMTYVPDDMLSFWLVYQLVIFHLASGYEEVLIAP